MSDVAGSEVEVSSEGGSDAERFEEAASQVEEGAAEQAERGTAVPAIPAWAAELLEQLQGTASHRLCVSVSSRERSHHVVVLPPARVRCSWFGSGARAR